MYRSNDVEIEVPISGPVPGQKKRKYNTNNGQSESGSPKSGATSVINIKQEPLSSLDNGRRCVAGTEREFRHPNRRASSP